MSNITSEQLAKDLLSPFQSAINLSGINDKFLIKQLKQELRAKTTKIQKVKGQLTEDDLPKTKSGKIKSGYRIIGYSSDETLVAIDMINHGIRQKARMDVHKLRSDYPAEKHEHSGSVAVQREYTEEDKAVFKEMGDKVVQGIIDAHRQGIINGKT